MSEVRKVKKKLRALLREVSKQRSFYKS